MRVRAVKSLASEKTCDQNPRDPIAAFCGIGNPTAFFEQLCSLGYNLVVTRSFPDHYRYRQRDIDLVVAEAGKRGAQSLITTAKDAVKLHDLQFRLPCHVLEVEIEIDQESQFLELLSSLPKAGDN